MKHTFAPYEDKSLSDFKVVNDSHAIAVKVVEEYLADLDSRRLTGRGLTIVGPNGTGKTLLASIVLNFARQAEYRIEAIELSIYVALHKDKFALQRLIKTNDDEEALDEYIKVRHHLRHIQGISRHCADWVLFDDVGREYASESGWSQGEFFDTLRSRWNRGLPSILTTNQPFTELERRYTEGMSSLLQESTEVIMLEGDDYRWRRAN